MKSSHPALLLSLLSACATPTLPASDTDPARASEEEPAEELAVVRDEGSETDVMSDPRIVLSDERGAPVPNALVVVVSQGYQVVLGSAGAPLRADEDGIVALDAPLSDVVVLAWAPGRAAARVEVPDVDAPSETRVILGPPTALHGRLLGRGRIEHVWLSSVEDDAPWPHFVRCDVDDEGRFRVEGLAAGSYRVFSVPIGGAPVLAADTAGQVRFLSGEPGPMPRPEHRFLDREIVADGRAHSLRIAFGSAEVSGRVLDESGVPVEGAAVRFTTEAGRDTHATTDARGLFSAGVRPAPFLHISASHSDFGEQWTEMEWDGWRHGGPFPDAPVELTLRRGVSLHGRLVDENGAPVANTPIVLVPAYVGSGPATKETRTDVEGRFRFEPMALRNFELVPQSLRNWYPREPGDYRRIADPNAAEWLAAATEGRGLELRIERFELVPVVVNVGGSTSQIELWTRWGEDLYSGSAPQVTDGRVRVLMERGLSHELWADPYTRGQSLVAPWTRDVAPDWTGTPDGDLEITLE